MVLVVSDFDVIFDYIVVDDFLVVERVYWGIVLFVECLFVFLGLGCSGCYLEM